jgi:hypothetical protein
VDETPRDADECAACAWKDDLIVELQRELQHELETERLANADWPVDERTRAAAEAARRA